MMKILDRFVKKQFSEKQVYMALVFAIGAGLMAAVLSGTPEDVPENVATGSITTPSETAVIESSEQEEKVTTEETTEAEKEYVPSIDKLNLAYYYPEGADTEDQLNSYAGEVYKELMKKDNEYLARIFDTSGMSPRSMASKLGVSISRVMGKYNPSDGTQDPNDPSTWFIPNFRNVNVAFYNADGKRINECSNVKDIMAMASVYCYSHGSLDADKFKKYCEALYGKSRNYSVSIGNVYYDDGCINRSAKEEAEGAKKTESTLELLKKRLSSEGETTMLYSDEAVPMDIGVSEDGDNALPETFAQNSSVMAKDGVVMMDSAADSAMNTEGATVDFSMNSAGAMADPMANAAGATDNSAAYSSENAESESEFGPGYHNQDVAPATELHPSVGPTVPDTAAADIHDIYFEGLQLETGGPEVAAGSGDLENTETAADIYYQSGVAQNQGSVAGNQNGMAQNQGNVAGNQNAEIQDQGGAAEKKAEGSGKKRGASAVLNTILGSYSMEDLQRMDDTTLTGIIDEAYEDIDNKRNTNTETNVKSKNYCPGHVDLYVKVTISGFDDENGLRKIKISSDIFEDDEEWTGWTEENIAAVQALTSLDWYKSYGFSISTIDPKNPLTEEEISRYLDSLPKDISAKRKRVIKFALESVGKVPYYYGGKAGAKGYEKNYFGSIVNPDHRGRILRGLDCSGWIQWVYWSAIGDRLNGSASTSSLVGEGEKIKRADLQPGDIIIREGADSHVVMFLSWGSNGKMVAIHENGSANNVSVNEVMASYPYYRKLIN
ncbi:cell wall-associated hydrolase, invasion-associated protein [Lachnospiraceae bacterium JC7]|nr:cell wall-associated hydrolase, invasion-associated protein [Lachnospiraceae bacterium JC7]